jgi:aminopeptidase N
MEAESGRDLSRFFERWVFDSGVPRVRYAASIGAEEVSVRLEQLGETYDLPVTVTLQYSDGRVQDEVVVLADAVTEARFPLKGGTLRGVDVNQDHAALAHFERSR